MLPSESPEHLSDLIAATRAAKTTSLLLGGLPPSVDSELQTQLATTHRLNGAAVEYGDMTVLGFRLPPEALRVLDLV
jgi:hypothetical protein